MTPSADRHLMLLHGLGGCGGDWERVIAALGGWSAFVPDLPGHGGRPAPGRYAFDLLADDVAGRERRRPLVLVGTSLGAATAMTIASQAPELVAGMLLIAPAWCDEVEPENLRRLQKVGRIVLREGLERAWEILSATPPLSWWSAAERAESRARFIRADPEGVGRALVELPRVLPRRELAGVRCAGVPVRVLTWDRDPIHPVSVASAVCALLAAEVEVVARPHSRDEEACLIARAIESVARG